MRPLCYSIGYLVIRWHKYSKTQFVIDLWIVIDALCHTDNLVVLGTTKQCLPYIFCRSHTHKIISKENLSPA